MNNKYCIVICFMICLNIDLFAFLGNGSFTAPYQLWNLSDLQEMSDSVNNGNDFHNKHFILMNDIDTLKTPITYDNST